jgi:glutathione S-transferase
MHPSRPAQVVTHPPTHTTTVHLPSVKELRDVNTSDPKFREGALYGAGAVALAGAAAFGLYKLYQYYTLKTTHYKLSYFNGRALAETSRYLFALAGVEYEDFRYPPTVNDIPSPAFVAVKDSLPFGQLPTLQVGGPNGIVLSQSKAIERYLARQFGFMGCNEIQTQLIDSIGEAIQDLRNTYNNKVRDNPNVAEKEKFFTNTLVTTLRYINRLADQHSTSAERNTLIGNSITLADAQLYHYLSVFDDQAAISKAVDNFPIVKASRQNFGNHPAIQAWIAKRPVTSW